MHPVSISLPTPPSPQALAKFTTSQRSKVSHQDVEAQLPCNEAETSPVFLLVPSSCKYFSSVPVPVGVVSIHSTELIHGKGKGSFKLSFQAGFPLPGSRTMVGGLLQKGSATEIHTSSSGLLQVHVNPSKKGISARSPSCCSLPNSGQLRLLPSAAQKDSAP